MSKLDSNTSVSTTVTTPAFRISYPHVFNPQVNQLSKELEYSVEALFKKGENLSKLQAAAQAACVKKWGPDKAKWPAMNRNPFRDQKEKTKDGKLSDGLAPGAIFMRFKCKAAKHKPTVVGGNLQPIMEESKFYAGGWACASVNAYAFIKGTNAGVAFGLNALQFVRDDEPFSGRPSVEDAFEPVADEGGEMSGNGAPAMDATSMFS